MKTALKIIIIAMIIWLIPNLCHANVENTIRQFGKALLESKGHYLEFLDTTTLADTKEFVTILRGNKKILNEFIKTFNQLDKDTCSFKILNSNFCMTDVKRYTLIFTKPNGRMFYDATLYFLVKSESEGKNIKLFNYASKQFLITQYHKEIEAIYGEIKDLVSLKFDFTKFTKNSRMLNVQAFIDSTNANWYKYSSFQKFYKEQLDYDIDILNYSVSTVNNAEKSTYYPQIIVHIEFNDQTYELLIELRDCNQFTDSSTYFLVGLRQLFRAE